MSLATFPKKRLDIFVEAPALNRVLDALTAAQVQGYTVLEAREGLGHMGHWRLDDSFNSATNVLVIVCILDASLADAAINALYDVVRLQIGVLTVSDVMVVRPEHF
jgi:PII-like signaling protein